MASSTEIARPVLPITTAISTARISPAASDGDCDGDCDSRPTLVIHLAPARDLYDLPVTRVARSGLDEQQWLW
jgi:hypothetical protein